jgi:hypothetical protein
MGYGLSVSQNALGAQFDKDLKDVDNFTTLKLADGAIQARFESNMVISP